MEQRSGDGFISLGIDFCNGEGEKITSSIVSMREAKILVDKLKEEIEKVDVGIAQNDHQEQLEFLSGRGICENCAAD